jgi:hypothetical protein
MIWRERNQNLNWQEPSIPILKQSINDFHDAFSEGIGCVLGSHGLGSHLVVPPTGNPPTGLGNRSQPNWDEGPT